MVVQQRAQIPGTCGYKNGYQSQRIFGPQSTFERLQKQHGYIFPANNNCHYKSPFRWSRRPGTNRRHSAWEAGCKLENKEHCEFRYLFPAIEFRQNSQFPAAWLLMEFTHN
jgi:hypothetical protein